jgi:hypothetical protein
MSKILIVEDELVLSRDIKETLAVTVQAASSSKALMGKSEGAI